MLTLCSTLFRENDLVYIPPIEGEAAEWVTSGDGLWDAPACFTHKYPVKSRFVHLLKENDSLGVSISSLLTDVLGIANYSWKDIIEELKYCKASLRTGDVNKFRLLYGDLLKMAQINGGKFKAGLR